MKTILIVLAGLALFLLGAASLAGFIVFACWLKIKDGGAGVSD